VRRGQKKKEEKADLRLFPAIFSPFALCEHSVLCEWLYIDMFVALFFFNEGKRGRGGRDEEGR
jgi:hypothetical protein